jgi:hypothetical protein
MEQIPSVRTISKQLEQVFYCAFPRFEKTSGVRGCLVRGENRLVRRCHSRGKIQQSAFVDKEGEATEEKKTISVKRGQNYGGPQTYFNLVYGWKLHPRIFDFLKMFHSTDTKCMSEGAEWNGSHATHKFETPVLRSFPAALSSRRAFQDARR